MSLLSISFMSAACKKLLKFPLDQCIPSLEYTLKMTRELREPAVNGYPSNQNIKTVDVQILQRLCNTVNLVIIQICELFCISVNYMYVSITVHTLVKRHISLKN